MSALAFNQRVKCTTRKASEHTRFQHLQTLLNDLEAKGVMYHLFGSTATWCPTTNISEVEVEDDPEYSVHEDSVAPHLRLRGTKRK